MDKLKRLDEFRGRPGPLLVVIMDGVGISQEEEGNAVLLARTPTLDWLFGHCPHLLLQAHGTAVGLPSDDDMGNSEVGHNAIGAGRVFDQGAKLVNRALRTGEMFAGPVWRRLIDNCLRHHTPLHFIGLFSDGNVHSHIDHLKAMLLQAKREGVEKARIHVLLDGRDVGETSALEYVRPFEEFLATLNREGVDYRIASGGGRMKITMDRYEANWDMVALGWKTHVHGLGEQFRSAEEAITTFRTRHPGVIDQDLPPFVIAENGQPVGRIEDHHSVIFFNFRGDRAIEISRAFEEDDFDKFDRSPRPQVEYAGMMQYDGDLKIPKSYLVAPPAIDRTMGELLVGAGVRQFACSETQKYGHVTYFWNGNRSGKFNEELEEYVEIPSDIVPFEQRPWMKSAEITDRTIELLRSGLYRWGRINYPNGDMVGHTGVLHAAIVAVEAVDLALGRLLPVIRELHGLAIITADHGNSEEMFERKNGKVVTDANGNPKAKTSHTLNPVPFIIYDPDYAGEYRLREQVQRCGLSNIAATIMNLLGFAAPEDYDESLVEFRRR
ncbi:MAG: 2,3-bisphosphoglycerate-independent phosphoglycerate mutase [candidate division KSB1 bacterium]|nr:2,3-bisphosphoglycerate-independent phosphoglycerate mutase [candidate division KSB1 bacterium]